VNHTPSFTTDTPFDRKIKKSVIKDSLILMNISVDNRIKYKNLKKIELQKRVLTGKKLKLTPEEKSKLIEIAQQERDEYEAKHLGGFVKVYPLGTPEEKVYDDFIKYSTKLWEEWTGASNNSLDLFFL
jgi:tubulin polyglutamylase TTLL6/13